MDLLEIAKERRANLARELSKLDEFIRMGEELAKSASGKPAAEADSARRTGSEQSGPSTVRQFSAESAAAKSG